MYSAKLKIKILLMIFLTAIIIQGCENSVSEKSESLNRSAGRNESESGSDINSVKISLDLSFGKHSMGMNKMLESNLGTHFNNITKVDAKLASGEELDLQEIQPFGIFGLYLSSDDMFELTNSDGLILSSKSLLLEKCSFIDLKVKNPTASEIHLTGFVAGE